jgi:uncharacterized damage-inducible protein DinB
MRISELLLPEYDQEMITTRRVLERVPDDRGAWKPHPKAFPMAHLAQLVARLPGWLPMTMDRTELDIAPKDGPKFPGYSIETTATLLKEFDANVVAGRAAIANATDEAFQVPWTLKAGGTTISTTPRFLVVRSMVINHIVHHRAQLGLSLRLADLKVPQMYGPTADDRR